MKYEIDTVTLLREDGGFWEIESQIATLTGLELDEIQAVTSKVTRYNGQAFVNIFRQLGYSTNNRFIKFDKQTKYPCLMRTRKIGVKKYWFGFVYYDDMVYIPGNLYPLSWAQWNNMYPNHRITSMLQVWV